MSVTRSVTRSVKRSYHDCYHYVTVHVTIPVTMCYHVCFPCVTMIVSTTVDTSIIMLILCAFPRHILPLLLRLSFFVTMSDVHVKQTCMGVTKQRISKATAYFSRVFPWRCMLHTSTVGSAQPILPTGWPLFLQHTLCTFALPRIASVDAWPSFQDYCLCLVYFDQLPAISYLVTCHCIVLTWPTLVMTACTSPSRCQVPRVSISIQSVPLWTLHFTSQPATSYY